jgi:hypothetical protein
MALQTERPMTTEELQRLEQIAGVLMLDAPRLAKCLRCFQLPESRWARMSPIVRRAVPLICVGLGSGFAYLGYSMCASGLARAIVEIRP